MVMKKEEINKLINMERRVIEDMDKAIRMAGGGLMVEMAAKEANLHHESVIKALEEYRDLLSVKKLIDGEGGGK